VGGEVYKKLKRVNMRWLIVCLIIFSLEAKLIKTNGYIVDTVNKLIWQDEKDNIYIRLSQEEAISYCKKIPSGNWHLPSRKEYKTILDLKRAKKEEIGINKIFKYVLKDDYWTNDRTWLRNFGYYGYYLHIQTAHFFYENRTYKKFVRCVKKLK